MAQRISLGGDTFRTLLNPAPVRGEVSDVTWKRTVGGRDVATLWSPKRRQWGYRIWLLRGDSPDDETTWDAFIAGLSNLSSSFALIDHSGDSYTVRFAADPKVVYDDVDDMLIDIDLVEVRTS